MLISHHLEVGEKRKLPRRGRVVALGWQVHRLILFSMSLGVKMGASELLGIT